MDSAGPSALWSPDSWSFFRGATEGLISPSSFKGFNGPSPPGTAAPDAVSSSGEVDPLGSAQA